jgi:ABC-type branched-subunit amino acid transport system substrate-binding protein
MAALYDAINLIGQTIMHTDKRLYELDVTELLKAIVQTASNIEGVTGNLAFDENGDRKFYSYGLYELKKIDEKNFKWELIKNIAN